MLQAWISSPRGSLYFAAEVTPYNLDHLRAHVRAFRRGAGEHQTCLALNLGCVVDENAVADVARLARQLTGEGIQVCIEGADCRRYGVAVGDGVGQNALGNSGASLI